MQHQSSETNLIPEVDERYLQEWITWGIKECEFFLGVHAAFERYYSKRSAE
jgi:hypothetical protein